MYFTFSWGLIQFQDSSINSTEFLPNDKWIATNALLDTYSALKVYFSLESLMYGSSYYHN